MRSSWRWVKTTCQARLLRNEKPSSGAYSTSKANLTGGSTSLNSKTSSSVSPTSRSTRQTDRVGWILEFYIKPEHRMNGMGRYLYENTVTEFKGRVTDLWLTTDPDAIGFWEAMGYRQTGRMADFNEYEIMEANLVT